MATKKPTATNVSAVHKEAHQSLHTALDTYHEQLNRLHQQELEIRQKQAITKMAALNEISTTAAGKQLLAGSALAQARVMCW